MRAGGQGGSGGYAFHRGAGAWPLISRPFRATMRKCGGRLVSRQESRFFPWGSRRPLSSPCDASPSFLQVGRRVPAWGEDGGPSPSESTKIPVVQGAQPLGSPHRGGTSIYQGSFLIFGMRGVGSGALPSLTTPRGGELEGGMVSRGLSVLRSAEGAAMLVVRGA
jgi:hypothetical protein